MKKYYWILFLLVVITSKSHGSTDSLISFNLALQELNFATNTIRDTTELIKHHLKEADINKNKGLYAVAYEHLWDAMLYANAINDIDQLTSIHDELGVLYGIYGKEDKAIEHKKMALYNAKKSELKKNKESRNLIKAYYNLAVQFRKAKKYENGLIYLDSCLYVEDKIPSRKHNPYVLAERGNIFLLQNNLIEAETLLLKATQDFEKGNKHYLVIIYSFLGDLYLKKRNLDKAIYFYEKSLSSMYVFESHTDLKADILKKIAGLYKTQNQLTKAYFYLEESSKISDSMFSMRNDNNSKLFEIKNKYKATIAKKDKYISRQEHILEEKKQIQSSLIFILGFIVFGVIIVFIVLHHKRKINKLKIEKENTAIKIKHDKEKLNLVLENKRKELTVSALQLLEKEKDIDKLLDVLKSDSPETHRKIKEEINRSNKDLWESFNLRFTEVNTNFYKRLQEKHSALTPTEQKHCALIKLKFDSKEMARLLNISISSVHISRHRIRKKIGLQRDDNLSNYIANL